MASDDKKPLSIFEFPLRTWEEFCVIKLLADLAEILQVEDLAQCSFLPKQPLDDIEKTQAKMDSWQRGKSQI